MLARICREAGARVMYNAFLRDMNLGVRADGERLIEVLTQDLLCFSGAQLTVDVTLHGEDSQELLKKMALYSSRPDGTTRELTQSL